MGNELKTVYRYDVGGKAFRKVALLLVGLAGILAVFGFVWVKSWF